jgi:hypothetical protein
LIFQKSSPDQQGICLFMHVLGTKEEIVQSKMGNEISFFLADVYLDNHFLILRAYVSCKKKHRMVQGYCHVEKPEFNLY